LETKPYKEKCILHEHSYAREVAMRFGKVICSTAALSALALVCSSCDSKTMLDNPSLGSDQILSSNTKYAKSWPNKPALFKLSNKLLLQIPPNYQRFWEQGDKVIRPPVNLATLSAGGLVGFQFFMPDFSGYTPENYEKEFDEEKVDVVYLEYKGMGPEQPKAAGAYPPNVFQRVIVDSEPIFDAQKFEDKFGLRCYEPRLNNDVDPICYGKRDNKHDEYIILEIMKPPYEKWVKYPLMQARYFTPQYGGMEIVWRAHMKHFPKWHEIDSQIWKFIDAWNISKSGNLPQQ
jgi:hypothetical protein